MIVRNCQECQKETKNPKFCSRSCAAKFNNRHYPKRGDGRGRICPVCDGTKDYASQKCRECKTNERFQIQLKRTLKDTTSKGNARVKWAWVRSIAKLVLEKAGRKKECANCGFNLFVDVCHIKSINKFEENEILRVVNSPDNLLYLCPNCHGLLDRGLLNLVSSSKG